MIELSLRTNNKREVVDITGFIDDHCEGSGIRTGWCFLSTLHTTCAVSVADLDPGTDLDMLDAFEKMIPKLQYRHPHDPGHAPDHILSALIGNSIMLPVERGELVLGTWQRAVLFEFNGPKQRLLKLSFIKQ